MYLEVRYLYNLYKIINLLPYKNFNKFASSFQTTVFVDHLQKKKKNTAKGTLDIDITLIF